MTRCISETWEEYSSFHESPMHEIIFEWVRKQIEIDRPTIKGKKRVRISFHPKDWDDVDLDPDELANEITKMIGRSEALREVAYLVALNSHIKEDEQ